ncbi:MAG: TVP38/TMEM64 family protein [Proteobacteria bacterium]|nr:TVP38/TMEM64 family protein [Pseudomonadota bacterium]
MEDDPATSKEGSAFGRLWPIAALLLALILLFLFGPDNETLFEALRTHRVKLLALVADHAVFAELVFAVIYAAAIALSIPGGAMMTLIGGFLFGPLRTTLYVVVAATLGATVLFLIARGAVGDRLRTRAGPWMAKMEDGFKENAMSYLLVLRLVPLFPFFVVNLVPAFLGVPLRTYVIATFFGIMPGTFVFALAGSGLGSALEASGDFSVSAVLTPDIIAALVGLAALALVPVLYKKFRGRHGA